MSEVKDFLKQVVILAAKVIDKAQENPVRVAVTADMLASAFRFAQDLWDQFDDLTPEEERALYAEYEKFFTDQKKQMKERLAAARTKKG